MGKLTRQYARLFETKEEWLDAFSKILIESLEKHNLMVKACEGREWCIEIHTEDLDAVYAFLEAINEELNHEFTIESTEGGIVTAVCEYHAESVTEDEDIELDIIEEEPEDGEEAGEEELLSDTPGSPEGEFGTMDDFETFKEKKDFVGAVDYEGKMAKSQLSAIAEHAQEIIDMIEDDTQLPAWIQSKITLADAYIDEVYHRMKH